MPLDDSTCWTMVREAAANQGDARQLFAGRYLGLVRSYLAARWRGSPGLEHLDDACQDVFWECFRPEGSLDRADPEHGGRFKSYLYAVIRNVARRYEERGSRIAELRGDSVLDALPAEGQDLEQVFDRAWARSILQRASERHQSWALADGEEGAQRLKILNLKFGGGKPIREIAATLKIDPELAHAEYRKARLEFKRAMREEVLFHHPEGVTDIDLECQRILELFT